jgi:uncharacterized membrane protein YfcA
MIAVALIVAGICVSALLTPVGISGAFLLVPFQHTILGVTSVSVTPTNLLFNVIATPAAIFGYHRAGRLDRRLAALISAGRVPGVLVGSRARTHLLADPQRFRLFMGAVLIALACSLLVDRRQAADERQRWEGRTAAFVVVAAAVVGVVGGIYGVGGGAFLAPLLTLVTGCSLRQTAGATLVGTFVTSVAGVAAFEIASFASGDPALGPDWVHGGLLGLGGVVGGFAGASWQERLPERGLRAVLTVTVGALGVAYVAGRLLA